MRLQEFSFKIEHITGKENIAADALSRIPWRLESRKQHNSEAALPSDMSDAEHVSELSESENDDMLPALPAL